MDVGSNPGKMLLFFGVFFLFLVCVFSKLVLYVLHVCICNDFFLLIFRLVACCIC